MIETHRHRRRKSGTDSWITPRPIITALGPFDLDPCASIPQPWPCARESFTVEDSGLLRPWRGRVWLNPPYSLTLVGAFLERMAAHASGTALLFARTDTRNWSRFVWPVAHSLLFMEGRVNFHRPDGSLPRRGNNSGGPSVLAAYAEFDTEKLADSGIRGALVLLGGATHFVVAIPQTWRDVVEAALVDDMTLAQLYRSIDGHPKTAGNVHWQAKVRQQLQVHPGFRRLGRGKWGPA